MAEFRFRPRYRGVALTALGVGGSLSVVGAITGVVSAVAGLFGIVFGAVYLMSPTWKLRLVIDDTGLAVTSPRGDKLRLAWGDIVAVTASPSTTTCFVNGGSPANSLLIPGDGAPAPYDIENKYEAYTAILAHVPADKVKIVQSLDAAPTPA